MSDENILVSIKNLSFSYGNKEVLENINLDVPAGIVLGIVGPNGGGKTTLLRIILGLLKKYRGEIKINCQYSHSGGNIHHRCFGYVPQKSAINRQFPATVRDTVIMGLYGLTGFAGASREEKEYAEWLLKEVGIYDIKDKAINEISGGQFQRTLIARALVTKPSLLLMDEPLVGIDQAGILKFTELVLMLKKRLGVTLILVSHDFNAVSVCADKVACLSRTIHFHDNPEHLTVEDLTRVYTCGFEAFKDVGKFLTERREGK